MKRPIAEREQIVSAFVKKEIGKDTAAKLLGCTKRTFRSYVTAYLAFGVSGLVDHRRSNRRILTASQIDTVVSLKRTEEWRLPETSGTILPCRSMHEPCGKFWLHEG